MEWGHWLEPSREKMIGMWNAPIYLNTVYNKLLLRWGLDPVSIPLKIHFEEKIGIWYSVLIQNIYKNWPSISQILGVFILNLMI